MSINNIVLRQLYKKRDFNEIIGVLINIEAQGTIHNPYPLISRAIYYGARLLSNQKNDYKNLEKIYSIWICADNRRNKRTTISEYCISENVLLGDNYNNKDDYGLINVVMIYLTNISEIDKLKTKENLNYLTDLLRIILARETKIDAGIKEKLEIEYGIIVSKEDVTDMCNWSESFIEKGYMQGFEEGETKGFINATVNSIKNVMSTLNISFEKAMDTIKVDDEIKEEVIRTFKEKYS